MRGLSGLSGLAGLLRPLPLLSPSLLPQPPRSLSLSLTGLAGLDGWVLQPPLCARRSAALAVASSCCWAGGSLRCGQGRERAVEEDESGGQRGPSKRSSM